MRRRCNYPQDRGYKNYGGRGIKVCERWDTSFAAFLEDMGKAPSPKHSIDRVNNNGNYEPGNCRWATMKEQMQNRRGVQSIENVTDDALIAEIVRRAESNLDLVQRVAVALQAVTQATPTTS